MNQNKISSDVPHISVMLQEVLTQLAPKDGGVYVDGTFGAGGYSKAILDSADCKVIAIDRDPNVRPFADQLAKEYPERIDLLLGEFAQMQSLLEQEKITHVDGIVLDIGVSSMQIDDGSRGFSFMQDGPLDMRMSSDGMSAADVINTMDEVQLADIIYHYGGERKSRRVAKAIVRARQESEITTTRQLADIVRSVVYMSNHRIDPATRTFQAIRIWVNDELGQLTAALDASEALLAPGGRVVVVTFHSLEDSIVKKFFKSKAKQPSGAGVSRHLPILRSEEKAPVSHHQPSFHVITKKALEATRSEIKLNPRSRSAKLRAAQRLDAREPMLGDES